MTEFGDLEQALAWSSRQIRDLAFVGPDPHYAIGLDLLVPRLAIACVDDGPALPVLEGVGSLVLALARADASELDPSGPEEVERPSVRPQGRSAVAVLKDRRTQDFLQRESVRRVLVFKNSHAIEEATSDLGLSLLAPASSLARRWENKLAFMQIGKELGLRLPLAEQVELVSANYRQVAERLGRTLVVQAPHGYAGARTILVRNEDEFEAARRTMRAPFVRVSSHVEGHPMTLNACVTSSGIAVGRPFEQITGVPEFTPHELGSCGQVWSGVLPQGVSIGLMIDAARTIGKALADDGFRGIFGVDFVSPTEEAPYVIEVNPRLVASIAAYTQLELLAGRVPLLLRHLAAFIAPDDDQVPLDGHLAPLEGAQLVLHNVEDAARPVPLDVHGKWHQLKISNTALDTEPSEPSEHAEVQEELAEPGARWGRSEHGRDSIHLSEIRDGQAIVLTGPVDRSTASGAEWARVQMRGRASVNRALDTSSEHSIIELGKEICGCTPEADTSF